MNKKYELLEPDITSSLGTKKLSFDTSNAVSLFATTEFLYMTAIMFIIGVAAFRLMLAGVWRIEASERGVRKSNEEIKRVSLGLIGVLSLFLILYTFNKGLLRGDVGLEGLRTKTGAGSVALVVPSAAVSPSGGTARACEATESVITKLKSPEGLCGGTACSALSGCNYQQYLPIIERESSRQGVDKKLVIAIMCAESRGRNDARNQNPDGTYDCGLMQINQKGDCSSSSFDPDANITAGVVHLKRVVSSSNQVYQNIPREASVAASYNCCSNGTAPNSASADCTQASGFPYAIPKWACPINPGSSQFNMCSVKSYACQISACVRQLSGSGL